MRLTASKISVAVVIACLGTRASASFLTCSESVNGQAGVVIDQFPQSLQYDLTVTEAWCAWCATQDGNHWCHQGCSVGEGSSLVWNETDPVLASFGGAAIPWVTTNPPWVDVFPFWLRNGESVTTQVNFTLASYADCATRARGLPNPVLPDANGLVMVADEYRVVWSLDGVPPFDAACSAAVKCVPPLGPTRTLGYFRTHPAAVTTCLTPGAIDLGFMWVGNATTALGLLGASPAMYADGTKRSALDQARVLLARQLLVATCNGRVFGSTPAEDLLQPAVQALAGTSCATMKWLGGQLDAFNNSGDTGENWFGSATPATYPDPTVKTSGLCQ